MIKTSTEILDFIVLEYSPIQRRFQTTTANEVLRRNLKLARDNSTRSTLWLMVGAFRTEREAEAAEQGLNRMFHGAPVTT